MTLTATLIAASPDRNFASLTQDCHAHLTTLGYAVEAFIPLHPDQAYDLLIRSGEASVLRTAIADFIAARPVDVIVQPADGRRKKFLLADMESTMIRQEMLEEMADIIGARDHVAEVTRRAMNGEIDFVTALCERVALFAGQPATLLDLMRERIALMPGAVALVATMRAHGALCWLASGGFRCFTQPVAAQLGFDQDFANDLLIENGRLTGMIAEPILDKNAKRAIFERGLFEARLTPAESIVAGDGANDLAMIAAATVGGGAGIAFRAKPAVQSQATHKIIHADLTALLYAQGYNVNEFTIKT